MPNKTLLTAIPTANDLKDTEAMAKILAENEQANLEAEVEELIHVCITKIMRRGQPWHKELLVHANSFSMKAIDIAIKNLRNQGWNAKFLKNHFVADKFQYQIVINTASDGQEPSIPTPEEFLNGADLPVFPVSILNNRESHEHRLLNKCLEGIKQQQKSSDKTACIDRKNMSDETAEDVARILRRSGWEAEVRYPMDIDHHDKVSPNMAAASARKYITISLPA